MKWQGGKQSDNFEDRRGMSSRGKVAIGGIGGVIILLIGLFMGGDPGQLLQQIATQQETTSGEPRELSVEEQELTEFSRIVLQSTEDVWGKLFREQANSEYLPTTLRVYDKTTDTDGCGVGQSAYGPFYCPTDQSIYIDLTFNDELRERFGAKGEFALAYVIAHEVGHHIQNILGVLQKTNALRAKISEQEYNKISVMTELQADFYAGVWAHYVNENSDVKLTYEDIVDGMRAAAAVGDDHIQKQAQGHANPESFTHGTSEQRAYWFKKGYDTGDLKAGDTFNAPSLK
ncbi:MULTISPECIES: neutral zinc metallopeptidase [Sphingobacterium]|uniref:KPN_02809 family neutral zinc metallopeptidase n=1 Tax=Sphingobacterium TaxID=28453 RepID=UPI0013D8EC73|nr:MULTISPECIES: neutral zinc metallopeptidase [unclassified Sphingobacterium]